MLLAVSCMLKPQRKSYVYAINKGQRWLVKGLGETRNLQKFLEKDVCNIFTTRLKYWQELYWQFKFAQGELGKLCWQIVMY